MVNSYYQTKVILLPLLSPSSCWPGKIKDKCENAGFYERLSLIEKQFKGTAVLLHKMGYLPPGFRQLWANQRLLNVVEQFIGPDIAGAVSLPVRSFIPTLSVGSRARV